MASETRATAESIRESARQAMQAYRAGSAIEGDDVANVAYDLEDAATEIARLTRELEEAREREKRRELAVGFIECAIGWLHSDDCDLLTTDDGDLREAVCELRNALDLLATPQEASDAD